jgi:hypothetical protein
MRCLAIGLFVLFGLPSPSWACFDEHKSGWFDEMPSPSWEVPLTGAEGFRWEAGIGLFAVAAGLASAALITLTSRAVLRERSRGRKNPVERDVPAPLVLPFDWPIDRPIRVDQGHDQPGPIVVIREAAVGSLVCIVPSDRSDNLSPART